MANIKIFLDKGESQHDAEQALFKALNHHNSGDVHSSHIFQDPAMANASSKMDEIYKKIHKEMIDEICEVLDQDYKKFYGY